MFGIGNNYFRGLQSNTGINHKNISIDDVLCWSPLFHWVYNKDTIATSFASYADLHLEIDSECRCWERDFTTKEMILISPFELSIYM